MVRQVGEPKEILRLRASRARIERIRDELEEARKVRLEVDERIERLQEEGRLARKERRADVLNADAAGIARAKIAREVGMQRSNVYKLIDSNDIDDEE